MQVPQRRKILSLCTSQEWRDFISRIQYLDRHIANHLEPELVPGGLERDAPSRRSLANPVSDLPMKHLLLIMLVEQTSRVFFRAPCQVFLRVRDSWKHSHQRLGTETHGMNL